MWIQDMHAPVVIWQSFNAISPSMMSWPTCPKSILPVYWPCNPQNTCWAKKKFQSHYWRLFWLHFIFKIAFSYFGIPDITSWHQPRGQVNNRRKSAGTNSARNRASREGKRHKISWIDQRSVICSTQHTIFHTCTHSNIGWGNIPFCHLGYWLIISLTPFTNSNLILKGLFNIAEICYAKSNVQIKIATLTDVINKTTVQLCISLHEYGLDYSA